MAAARAYTAAQSWESSSALSAQQLSAVASLASRCSDAGAAQQQQPAAPSGASTRARHLYIPVPAQVRREREQRRVMEELERAAAAAAGPGAGGAAGGEGDAPGAGASNGGDVDATEKATLSTASAFYTWWGDQEAAVLREKETKYKRYAAELEDGLGRCRALSAEIDGVIGLLDDLRALHRSVRGKTQSLTGACDRLVDEQRRLAAFADALRGKLEYFDELERLAPHCQGPTQLAVSDDSFFTMMRRLDECVAFVSEHPQYSDSAAYAVRFRQLQARALASVKAHVFGALKRATQQVTAAAREAGGSDGALPEGAETSVLYVKFRAATIDLRAVIAEMEARADKREYAQLLSECHSEYCDQRLALCMPVVEQRMSVFAAPGKPLDSLVRSGSAYLLLLCRQEQQLFDFLFQGAAEAAPGGGGGLEPAAAAGAAPGRGQPLGELLEPLADVLYDMLRPSVLSLTDIDYICDLVNILKGEVMEEHGGGAVTPGLMNVMSRILADMQERLIFRAQNFIRDEVTGYRIREEDLRYPDCLLPAAPAADAPGRASRFPPVSLTLSMLAKLYKCVDASIFSGLAQEAIAACTSVVREGHRQLSRRPGGAPKPDGGASSSGAGAGVHFEPLVDSSLFLIRQLLTLKEQITPFEVDICVIEKELDFSHMADQLQKIAVRAIPFDARALTNALAWGRPPDAPPPRPRSIPPPADRRPVAPELQHAQPAHHLHVERRAAREQHQARLEARARLGPGQVLRVLHHARDQGGRRADALLHHQGHRRARVELRERQGDQVAGVRVRGARAVDRGRRQDVAVDDAAGAGAQAAAVRAEREVLRPDRGAHQDERHRGARPDGRARRLGVRRGGAARDRDARQGGAGADARVPPGPVVKQFSVHIYRYRVGPRAPGARAASI